MRRLVGVLILLGCASGGASGRVASRPPGCAVQVFQEGGPTRPTENLGDVTAHCPEDTAGDLPGCMRMLQDQACRRGGDVLWAITTRRSEDALDLHGFVGRYR
ncbi:MAG: hypothetical protein HY909_17425 [Deltaproteobacteria bacterium]|nr:hypothetical protein [Deltaproteobacteria bacterium]